MRPRIKHVGISSTSRANQASFYETVFGMRRVRTEVSDGNIGMSINGRGVGRQAGIDHIGFEVDNAQEICDLVRDEYPKIEYLTRPGNRPFAGVGMHDPAGNVFDLSEPDGSNRADLYAEREEGWRARHITHVMLRAVDPDPLIAFYRDILRLTEEPRADGDPNTYLSDGRVCLVIAPWHITDYAGTGIARPALDHLGFEVEDLQAFEQDLERARIATPTFSAPVKPGTDEYEVRFKLLSHCSLGHHQLSDPEGILIDVAAAG